LNRRLRGSEIDDLGGGKIDRRRHIADIRSKVIWKMIFLINFEG